MTSSPNVATAAAAASRRVSKPEIFQSELYTWTQFRNTSMLRLNEQLGYVVSKTSVSLERRLPL